MSFNHPQFYSHDPHTDARRTIDEEIAKLEAKIVSLKVARNALAPITRLHSEIIQHIFYLIHFSSSDRGKASLSLTWISHSFRELAHNTSALWSYIDFHGSEWVQAALSHTKNRELEFDLHHVLRSEQNPGRLVSICLQHLPRIKKLTLRSRNDVDVRKVATVPPLVPTPEWMIQAPVLIYLRLDGVTLPPNTFSGICPALKTLHLSHSVVDWDTLPVTFGLKELVIQSCTPPTTVDTVLKLFRIIGPELEAVHLRGVFDEAPSGNVEPMPQLGRFRFEKLRSMILGAHSSDMVAPLLQSISLPHHANIEMDVSDWNEPNASQALQSARNISAWPVDYLEIRIEYDSVTFRITEDWSDMGNDAAGVKNSRTVIELKIFVVPQQLGLLPIFTILPIQPLKKVGFVGGYHDSQDMTIFRHIGEQGTVRELRIELPFVTAFMDFIGRQIQRLETADASRPGDEPLSTASRNIILFHNLQVLEIYNWELQTDRLSREEFVMLKQWLVWRNACGLRLERLVFSKMAIPAIEWLSGLFDELVKDFVMKDVVERDGDFRRRIY